MLSIDLILPLRTRRRLIAETNQYTRQKMKFVEEFEPRPSASAYDNELRLEGENKSFLKDFEPRPSANLQKMMKRRSL
ncbi:hypothetical protein Leryth_022688 [Lithospermum erythrorhizon]|nr:hypothetical protein Leryth_022688 [Lithospermum erythrorhizon]